MLKIKAVDLQYQELEIFKNLSFDVQNNEIVAIIGPSGCGKTSLLNMIGKLQEPTNGSIEVDGEKIAFIFQDDRLLPWKSVWDNIAIVGKEEKVNTIRNLIKEVGLEGFENYKPSQLSGGMKKRCGIARAFYYDSELLLMDEPFQGLDYTLRREMLQMLMEVWKKHQQPVVFVTHEIDEALQVAHRILVLSNRPSYIVEEFTLPLHSERNLKDLEVLKIRQKILELI